MCVGKMKSELVYHLQSADYCHYSSQIQSYFDLQAGIMVWK